MRLRPLSTTCPARWLQASVLTLLLSAPLGVAAQYNNEWVRYGGSPSEDNGRGVAVDQQGNSFVAARFNGSMTFGNTTLQAQNGSQDAALIKYDPQGNVLWARAGGSAGMDTPQWVTTDAAGNAYVVGYVDGSTTFGPFSQAGRGSYDAFLVKYDAQGNEQWLRLIGGTGDDEGFSVTTDAQGTVTIAGLFSDSISFAGSPLVASGNAYNTLLARFDAQGNEVWAKGLSTPALGRLHNARSITQDVSGNLYVTGEYGANGYRDVFLTALDNQGNILWLNKLNSTDDTGAYSVVADAYGNVFHTGRFSGTVTFGSSTFSASNYDFYLAKYDAATGALEWVTTASDPVVGYGSSLIVDPYGNPMVSGLFQGTLTFPNGTSLTSHGSYDAFIAWYDWSGAILTTKSIGGPGLDLAYGAQDLNGDSFVTGSFSATADLNGDPGTSNGDLDLYLIKIETAVPQLHPRTQPLHVARDLTDAAVRIYPNPVNGSTTSLKIEVPGRASVQLFNNIGQLVSTATGQDFLTLTTAGLPAGLYSTRVTTSTGSVTHKVIVTQ